MGLKSWTSVPGTTAPLGSVTVPFKLPDVPWARAPVTNKAREKRSNKCWEGLNIVEIAPIELNKPRAEKCDCSATARVAGRSVLGSVPKNSDTCKPKQSSVAGGGRLAISNRHRKIRSASAATESRAWMCSIGSGAKCWAQEVPNALQRRGGNDRPEPARCRLSSALGQRTGHACVRPAPYSSR